MNKFIRPVLLLSLTCAISIAAASDLKSQQYNAKGAFCNYKDGSTTKIENGAACPATNTKRQKSVTAQITTQTTTRSMAQGFDIRELDDYYSKSENSEEQAFNKMIAESAARNEQQANTKNPPSKPISQQKQK